MNARLAIGCDRHRPLFCLRLVHGVTLALLLLSLGSNVAVAQSPPSAADVAAEEALTSQPDAEPATTATPPIEAVSPFSLLVKGGWMMIPIAFLSVVVVAIAIERLFALRQQRMLPEPLVSELGQLAESSVFDPRQAYKVCQEHPSPAGRVVQAMLLKVGRPHAEVEQAVAAATQREADSLYWNIRTLNVSANLSPLLGLLGTVWGIIQAFFVTANMPDASNKAEALAEGIYIALITTFAGLIVAIPAAGLAHFFEGRIMRFMREIEILAASLLPQVERYEGKLRLDRQRLEGPDTAAADAAARAAQAARPQAPHTGAPVAPTR
jgi:biopolymer transport protein ExbB